MKERPILFSAPMVRAILEGRKTQTRRIARLTAAGRLKAAGSSKNWHPDDPEAVLACPYGVPGDRLWVREAWRLCEEANAVKPRDTNPAFRCWYEADVPHQPGFGRLRPGMFMPRWASRILLEITNVRVQRLQEISDADAVAEGLVGLDRPLHWFRQLWDSINSKRAPWSSNPWVRAITFAPIQHGTEE